VFLWSFLNKIYWILNLYNPIIWSSIISIEIDLKGTEWINTYEEIWLLRCVLCLIKLLSIMCTHWCEACCICNLKALVRGLALWALLSWRDSADSTVVTLSQEYQEVWGILLHLHESSSDSIVWNVFFPVPKCLHVMDCAGIWKRTHDCCHSFYF
jgi:hypothetical protein